MATQQCHVSLAHLCVAKSGRAILYLQTLYGEKLQVNLPPYLARVVQSLIEHHQQINNPIERHVDGFISAKGLAALMRRPMTNIYDLKSYIYRIRRLVRQAATEAGVAYTHFANFILSETSWGYAIHPDINHVSIKNL